MGEGRGGAGGRVAPGLGEKIKENVVPKMGDVDLRGEVRRDLRGLEGRRPRGLGVSSVEEGRNEREGDCGIYIFFPLHLSVSPLPNVHPLHFKAE